MEKPQFKDEYVTKAILENGKCYSVKPLAKKSLKNEYQKVIFALELEGDDLMRIKDLTIGNSSDLETTKKKGILTIKEGMIITTAADSFDSKEKFEKFYEDTDIQVGDFINEYMETLNVKQKNQVRAKPKPKTKR